MPHTVLSDNFKRVLGDIENETDAGRRKDGLQVFLQWWNDGLVALTNEQREVIEKTLRQHNLT